jgi:parallel beta-helix repeat protein
MENGFITHSAPKNHTNKLKWRLASAMLAGIALLFAFQGFTRADDDGNNDAKPISTCGTTIGQRGRYFIASDLSGCAGIVVTIAASDVKLELRDHTILGSQQGLQTDGVISVDGGGLVLSNVEIAGPGTVTGGMNGITFKDVHSSRVHNLVIVGNLNDGITINTSIPITVSAASTETNHHDNEFLDNVVTGNRVNGITSTGGTNDEFRDNVVSGNTNDGISLTNGMNDEFRGNVVTGNLINGITVTGGMNNEFRDNAVTANLITGIELDSSSGNSVIHNNLSANGAGDGLALSNATNSVVQRNTADSNANGIEQIGGSGNSFQDNTALGNSLANLVGI